MREWRVKKSVSRNEAARQSSGMHGHVRQERCLSLATDQHEINKCTCFCLLRAADLFAGRLADFGCDYRPLMQDAVQRARKTKNVEIIWASTREAFNVVEAHDMGCHIITAPADILKKLPALGTKSDAELSLDAVRAFRSDALSAGLSLSPSMSSAAE